MSDGIGAELHALATRLFPIARSITGPGFRETLDILEEHTGPMERHTWRTGEQVFDWTVPDEWAIRAAWIKDPSGRKVVDFAEHNLHVLGYSEPVHARMPLEELQSHLYSLPQQPTAIPYLTSYYKRRWGFCLAHEVREELVDGEYEVYVDADLGPGELVSGEVVVPGSGDGTVLFSTYCDHPSLANNELSGPVIAALLARELRGRSLRHTYRFVFVPETIGAIAYLSRFGSDLKRDLVAGWVITCAGDAGPLTYKRSRRGDALPDRVTEHVLRTHGMQHSIVGFFPSGSDERQYCSPGFDLPVGSLMRTMYGTYPEYHTSLDDLSFITPEGLGETFAAYLAIVESLESVATFRTLVAHGEPQLGKRGLYPSLGSQKDTAEQVMDMMWILNGSDGQTDLLQIAERASRPVSVLRSLADRLAEADLLERVG